MSVIERFVEYARALPDAERQDLEGMLESIMAAAEADVFSEEQLAEIDRRLAEEDPEFATDEEVAAAFQRTTRG